MKKFIIMIPVFNDWISLKHLLSEIDNEIKDIKQVEFNCYVINDSSTTNQPKFIKPNNFNSLKIFHMRENKGHARCNAFGIKYLSENINFDYLILMDGDGEDRPIEIKKLVEKALSGNESSVVAARIKRSEGILFKSLYEIHKLITLIFTGKKINFGNYSCLRKKDVMKLSKKKSLWSSFSGSVKKHLSNLDEIQSIRGLRYFGPSKMSLLNLVLHSFSIIAVFKNIVIIRSLLVFFILIFLKDNLGFFSLIIQILIILFCFIIFAVSFRENKKMLDQSNLNLDRIEEITH
tara:strand:- start:77 stop:949 length:873 start_codon:yes stop_codon:yes gene_type:complete